VLELICFLQDTGGEVIVQARNEEMCTLDTSTLFDFATSILQVVTHSSLARRV